MAGLLRSRIRVPRAVIRSRGHVASSGFLLCQCWQEGAHIAFTRTCVTTGVTRHASAEPPFRVAPKLDGSTMHGALLGRALALLLGLVIAMASDSAHALAEIPVRDNMDGAGPSHIFGLRDGRVAVIDPLTFKIFAYDLSSGSVAASSDLPPRWRPWRLVRRTDAVVIVDEDQKSTVTVPRRAEKWPSAFVEKKFAVGDPKLRIRPVQRVHAGLRFSPLPNSPALTVISVGPYYLASVRELDDIGDGNRYVLWKEYLFSEHGREEKKIEVHVYVGRFDNTGVLTGLVRLPLDEMQRIGFDYTTILENGDVALLASLNGGPFKIYTLAFQSPPPLLLKAYSSLGKRRRWPKDPRPTVAVSTTTLDGTEVISPRHSDPQSISTGPVQRIKTPRIAKMVAIMNSYRDERWMADDRSFRNPCNSQANGCAKDRFVLPPRETLRPLPEHFLGVAYDWGGADTIGDYRHKLAVGMTAGNIGGTFWAAGSPRVTAGVDCSGFVSNVWGLGQHVSTSDLGNITYPVDKLKDMRIGDAMLLPNHHVALFRGQVLLDGASLSIHVTEATSRCGFVCDSIYDIDQFNNYSLIRLRQTRRGNFRSAIRRHSSPH